MAGDWIKVEKHSANKPEVMRLARLWGVPQAHAFGLLVQFWCWIDDASVDGLVDGVASHEVDDMMRFPGFAAGLASVGWLEIYDLKPSIHIPNFDDHNSETSKKRALKNKRQAKWRLNSVDAPVDAPPSTTASTREEKRREDKEQTIMSSSQANIDAISLLQFLNEQTNRNFRPTRQTLKPIVSRLKDGFSVIECRAVIIRKRREWGSDDKMRQYLRPETLFNATKFAQYIGEVPPPAKLEAVA